jgi:hypothetical protein
MPHQGVLPRHLAHRLVILLNNSLRIMTMRLEEMATLKVLSVEYLREMKRLTDRIEKEFSA